MKTPPGQISLRVFWARLGRGRRKRDEPELSLGITNPIELRSSWVSPPPPPRGAEKKAPDVTNRPTVLAIVQFLKIKWDFP